MSCTCRAAPWRRFIQGLAQVHRLEPSATRQTVARSSRLAPSSTGLGPNGISGLIAARQSSRGLHTSKSLAQEAVAESAPESHARSDGADITSPTAVSEKAGDSQVAKPKKRRSRKDSAVATANDQTDESAKPKKRRAKKAETAETGETAEPKRRRSKKADAVVESADIEKPKKRRSKKLDEAGQSMEAAEPAGRRPRKRSTSKAASDDATRDGEKDMAGEAFLPPVAEDAGQGVPSAAKRAKQLRAADILPPQAKPPRRPKPEWAIQKEALKHKFPEGWMPRKRLSPDALAGIRALHSQFPDIYTTPALASKFAIPAEAMRRILSGKWTPNAEEEQKRQERWFRRGASVWERKAALGHKPPRRWRAEGIARAPSYHDGVKLATDREREIEKEEIRAYREMLEKKAEESGL